MATNELERIAENATAIIRHNMRTAYSEGDGPIVHTIIERAVREAYNAGVEAAVEQVDNIGTAVYGEDDTKLMRGVAQYVANLKLPEGKGGEDGE